MILIEKLAHNIAHNIALQMDYDEDKKAVIAYGLMAFLQMATIFIIISIIGLLFGIWYECIIIFISVGTIRKSTGGAHASTMMSCILISVLSIIMQSLLSRNVLGIPINIYINIGISIILFALCFIIFYIRVPVDSPNKPIVNPDKIKRLRKQSFSLLIGCFLLTVIFILLTRYEARFYSFSASIRLAMLWQLITLTKSGARILNKIDTYIIKFFH